MVSKRTREIERRISPPQWELSGSCFSGLSPGVMEKAMPVVLIWAVPGVIALGVMGHYLVAVAKLVDAALNLGMPPEEPLDRRRRFKVIEGGKAA
jgi:hypothetical protein